MSIVYNGSGNRGGSGSGSNAPVIMAIDQTTTGAFPTTRRDGSPLENGDRIIVKGSAILPFTLNDITFKSKGDELLWVNNKWELKSKSAVATDEIGLKTPSTEGMTGKETSQQEANKTFKTNIKYNYSEIEKRIYTTELDARTDGIDVLTTRKRVIDNEEMIERVIDKTFNFELNYKNKDKDYLEIILKNNKSPTQIPKRVNIDFKEKILFEEREQEIKNKKINAKNNTITNINTNNLEQEHLLTSNDDVVIYSEASDEDLITNKYLQKTLKNIEKPSSRKDATNKEYVDSIILQSITGIELKYYVSEEDPLEKDAYINENIFWCKNDIKEGLPVDYPLKVRKYLVEEEKWSEEEIEYIPIQPQYAYNLNNEKPDFYFINGSFYNKINVSVIVDNITIKQNREGQIEVSCIVEKVAELPQEGEPKKILYNYNNEYYIFKEIKEEEGKEPEYIYDKLFSKNDIVDTIDYDILNPEKDNDKIPNVGAVKNYINKDNFVYEKKEDYFYTTTINAKNTSIKGLAMVEKYCEDNLQKVEGCACSVIYNESGFVGRNFDYKYDDKPSLYTKIISLNYDCIGTTNILNTTNSEMETGIVNDEILYAPYLATDLVNDDGLWISSLLVPNDFGDTKQEAEGKEKLCSLIIPFFIATNFNKIETAFRYIKEKVNVWCPEGYEMHFIGGDKEGFVKVLEFINNETKIIDCDGDDTGDFAVGYKPFATNFHLWNINYIYDSAVGYYKIVLNSVEPHGQGLERYQEILKIQETLDTETKMCNFMQATLKYTNTYTKNIEDPDFWKTEYVGGDLTIDKPIEDFRERIEEAQNNFNIRSRTDGGKTWFTKLCNTYNLNKKGVKIIPQEGTNSYKYFIVDELLNIQIKDNYIKSGDREVEKINIEVNNNNGDDEDTCIKSIKVLDKEKNERTYKLSSKRKAVIDYLLLNDIDFDENDTLESLSKLYWRDIYKEGYIIQSIKDNAPVVPSSAGIIFELLNDGRYLCQADNKHSANTTCNPQAQNIKGTFVTKRSGDNSDTRTSGALFLANNQGLLAAGVNNNANSTGIGIDASRKSTDETENPIYQAKLTGNDRLRPATLFVNTWKVVYVD